jgi:hypothetical protein
MYRIYVDGNLLYVPTLAKEGYAVSNPKLEVELNKAGSLQFNLPPTNVMYDDVKKLKSVITVFDEKEEIWRGRVLHDEKNFYNQKETYCEGELAFFLDSIVRPYSYKGSVSGLVKKYVNEHNDQVDDWKQFKLGNVTVTDPNDYITRESSDYPNSFDEMQSKLVDLLGGYLRPRLSDGVRYLDYVTDYGITSDQVIEFGKNLLDISEYISADEVFTVLIPLGAEQQDKDGNETGKLTISSVNGGKDYIEDKAAIALFGRIVKVQEWEDVTEAKNLLSKGKQYLADGIEMAVSLTIKAVDLHLLDVNTERIKLGDMVRVVSLPHGLDKYFLCSKISYDLVNPQNTEYTLGITLKSMTEQQVSSQKKAQSEVTAVKGSVSTAQESTEEVKLTVQTINNKLDGMNLNKYVDFDTFNELEARVAALEERGSEENG